MSSNCVGFEGLDGMPMRTLVYHDMASKMVRGASGTTLSGINEDAKASGTRTELELSEEQLALRIRAERASAVQHLEGKLQSEFEQSLSRERAVLGKVIVDFTQKRDEYFARAETEVVQLALAIAAKILHRESQVEPMLVAALVRMAIDKMREGSSVTLRVGCGQESRWNEYFETQAQGIQVKIVEETTLTDHDCLVETELGEANFGLDTQLKEVEQGFFDLMALRPVKE